jgi:hypothetical protein
MPWAEYEPATELFKTNASSLKMATPTTTALLHPNEKFILLKWTKQNSYQHDKIIISTYCGKSYDDSCTVRIVSPTVIQALSRGTSELLETQSYWQTNYKLRRGYVRNAIMLDSVVSL